MKTPTPVSWTQLSVGWLLLLQLLSTSLSSVSRPEQRQNIDDDLPSLPPNCTARQVLQHEHQSSYQHRHR